MSHQPQLTAIIYDKRGRVLSIGKNSYVKTHPLQYKYAKRFKEFSKVYLHAELDAIIKLRNKGTPFLMRVFRYGRDGSPRCAKPCRICETAIREYGIERVEQT